SELDFAITPTGIRFGLGAVKNVGEGAAEAVVEARKAGGPFGSLDDFCDRLDLQRTNKRVIESLIKSGACDEFGPRLWQLDRLDQVLDTAQRGQRDRASGQVGLFAEFGVGGQLHAKFIPGPNSQFVDSPKEKLAWEKELLGIYLSAHPLNALAPRMKDVEDLVALAELREAQDDLVTIACVVTNARKHITKNKQLMMFAQVEALLGRARAVSRPVRPFTHLALGRGTAAPRHPFPGGARLRALHCPVPEDPGSPEGPRRRIAGGSRAPAQRRRYAPRPDVVPGQALTRACGGGRAGGWRRRRRDRPSALTGIGSPLA